METEKFAASIILTTHDTQKYESVINTVQNKLIANSEYNAFYKEALISDQYSYDVKQKAVLWLYSIEQSRLWGFRNFSGEALFLFTQKVLQYATASLSAESFNALASNPAFAESVDSDFNVPKIVFAIPFKFFIEERSKKEAMLNQLVASPNMNLGIAEVIINLNAMELVYTEREKWSLDDSLVIEWTRTTYEMGDVPDSWVRQFLMGAV